jgi:hypothetical protein
MPCSVWHYFCKIIKFELLSKQRYVVPENIHGGFGLSNTTNYGYTEYFRGSLGDNQQEYYNKKFIKELLGHNSK